MSKSGTGLQAGTDQYTYWSFPRSAYVTITVLNAGVDVGFGTTLGAGGPEAASYGPNDEYLTPGTLVRPDQFDAIRIKNHVPGSVAQYSIATRLVGDLPVGVPLGASFNPTYLTIDNAGNIGANFTGIINASGMVIKAAPSVITDANRIRWNSSNGAMVAEIAAEEDTERLQINARGQNIATHWPEIDLNAIEWNSGSGVAGLSITGRPVGASGIIRAVKAFAQGSSPFQTTIIDENNASDYLRLISTQQLAMSIGLVTLTWTTSNLSANLIANHGLGRTPQIVLATAFTAPAVGEIPALNTFSYNNTGFGINGDTRVSFTGTCQVNWLAIG